MLKLSDMLNKEIGKLIPIENKDGQQAVNARHLYGWLGVRKQFADWIKMQIDRCDLVENVDYEVFHQKVKNSNGGRPFDEYALSLNSAKEISMMSQTEKGKQARRYFIECERIAQQKEQPKQLSASEIMLMQAQMLVESEKRIKELEKNQKMLQSHQNGVDRRISRMEEQVRMVAYWSTVSGYAIRHKLDMSLQRAMVIGRKATKMAEEFRYTVEKVRDLRFGTVNAYPDWILAKVFQEYYPKVKFEI